MLAARVKSGAPRGWWRSRGCPSSILPADWCCSPARARKGSICTALKRVVAGNRRAAQSHPRARGDRAVAGEAQRAAGVVDHQEIGVVGVDVLHVRIVAARALHIPVDERPPPWDRRSRADWRSRTGHRSGAGCKGRVKLIGCIVERLVPNTSAEFICPLMGTFRKRRSVPENPPPCHHGN